MPAAEKPVKLPKSLAACADLLYTTRQDRLKLQKEVEAMQALETQIVQHLLEELPKSGATGMKGRLGVATIKQKEIVELYGTGSDTGDRFDKVYEYIRKNAGKDPGVWSLLQRRLNDATAKELIAAGKGAAIGARIGMIDVISVTKL